MDFDYMQPKIPSWYKKYLTRRFNEAHLWAILERATLLYNLRYPRELAIQRIENNIRWEFELDEEPEFTERVGEIVRDVYEQMSTPRSKSELIQSIQPLGTRLPYRQ